MKNSCFPILVFLAFLLIFPSCGKNRTQPLKAQEIVDRALEVSGGERIKRSSISFRFRDHRYEMEHKDGVRILKRIKDTNNVRVVDMLKPGGFVRYRNDSLLSLPDSMKTKYSNSINSVHYFAYLPYGLNDKAVRKEFLGETRISDRSYYKLRVTFEEEGGGKDFEDVYIYWFNTETFKPDYLAYEFHVDGGGMRFREAVNERYIEGIRFVDYRNYNPPDQAELPALDSLFEEGRLKLLSTIDLRDIEVIPGNGN